VKDLQIIGNGFRFELDVSINPSRIESARIVTAPATTTPATTSTTTTLFSYTGCDCIADFVLYFTQRGALQDTAAQDRLQHNTVWRVQSQPYTGAYSQQFIIPRPGGRAGIAATSREEVFMSACYCVQEDKMKSSGLVLQEMNEITGFGEK